jgi:hypothetical protein
MRAVTVYRCAKGLSACQVLFRGSMAFHMLGVSLVDMWGSRDITPKLRNSYLPSRIAIVFKSKD